MSSSQLHKPVLESQVVDSLKEHFSEDQTFFGIDGTFGRGGHFRALTSVFKNISILGLDQDHTAIEYATGEFENEISSNKLKVLHCNFSDSKKIKEEVQSKKTDFVFLDIGVSSPQLDNADRGFSFYNDGPLDMRMNQKEGETAADILNEFSLEDLKEVFLEYGEVYPPQKLLDAIERSRSEKPFETTLEFANLVEKVCGWRKKGMHPATLYFQALRIYVNKELDHLKEALEYYVNELAPGGVFLIISFHSLEDRIIKRFFKSSEQGSPVNKKVIKPTREEEIENKRSRSAKLRVFKKYELNETKGGRNV